MQPAGAGCVFLQACVGRKKLPASEPGEGVGVRNALRGRCLHFVASCFQRSRGSRCSL